MSSLFPDIDGAIRFFVDHEPIAQPRQRHAYVKSLGRTVNYIPKDHAIHVFKDVIRIRAKAAYNGEPLLGPIEAFFLFRLTRTQAMNKPSAKTGRIWAPGRPDNDNYVKGLFDALNGIIWKDDSQVVDLHSRKLYAASNEEPGVDIMIQELT